MGLGGTNAVAGNTVQLYNGTGTGSQLGTSYTLTAGDIANGFADVQTGALSNGTTYTLTARITDGAGNQSNASSSFVVTEDTSAPAAPVIGTVADDVSPITGTVADNGFSNDPTLTITGTAEAGSTVTIYDTDGTTVLGTGVATGGTYTITTSVLEPGQPYADGQGDRCGRQPGRGLDRVPCHHRYFGAGSAVDRVGDGRCVSGHRDGCRQWRHERHDTDDHRHGGGRQHGHDLRHRWHDGAGHRRCDRWHLHDHDIGA